MDFRGLQSGGTSWNGISIDVLKSGIQKYIRRGNVEKALWCTFELDLFSEMYFRGSDKETGIKALSTNLIHRLLIISIEDVGIGDPFLPLFVDKMVEAYKRDRWDQTLKDKRRGYLANLVSHMCSSKKTRELSHIRAVYYQVYTFDKKPYTIDGDPSGELHTFSVSNLQEQYPEIYSRDTSSVTFQEEYMKGSDMCFRPFLMAFSDAGESVSDQRKALMPFLTYVIDQCEDPRLQEVMKVLLRWFKEYSFKEYTLFGMQIVLLGLRHKCNTLSDKESKDLPEQWWREAYRKNVYNGPISIDSFVVDKHTREGRKSSTNNLSLFATEGALVLNEWEGTNPHYKEIYTRMRTYNFLEPSRSAKKSTDTRCEALYKSGEKAGTQCTNKGKTLVQSSDGEGHWYCHIHSRGQEVTQQEEIPLQFKVTHTITEEQLSVLHSADTPRGQLLTGKHKKQVMIPKDGEFKGLVVKGPWKSTDIQRLNTMLFRSRVMTLLGVRHSLFSVVNGADGNGYILMKNLSPVDPSQWKCERIHDKNIYMDILRVDRTSMGVLQMNTLPTDEQYRLLFGDQFIFKALILLTILRTGDVGMYNILVTEGIAHIVDFEETTSRVTEFSMENLFAKPVAKYTELFLRGCREHEQKCRDMVTEIDKHFPRIKTLAEKHGVKFIDIEREWSSIKKILL